MRMLMITEKPSVAKDVAPFLGTVTERNKDFIVIEGGRIYVTWCVGHITELASPDEYLPDDIPLNKKGRKVWRKQDLPILPKQWKVKVTLRDRFNAIKALVDRAKSAGADIVHAGDPDREGQLLVDRVLELCKVDPDSGLVKRVLPAALDESSIRKFLAAMQPNRNFTNLRMAAKARAFADWLTGMNGTRAVTLSNATFIPVGRVMTPTVALVVRRDRAIRNFVPKPFYVPFVVMRDGTRLTWRSRKELHPGIDEQGRIVDKALANRILAEARDGAWFVTDANAKEVKSAPPLPHNLSSLQQQLSNTHKMSAKQTLEAAQSLYENHKLTTYPRTDCRHLPNDQFGDRGQVLRAIASRFAKEVQGADPDRKSKAFDDSQVTAHHAIVPTGKLPDGCSLTRMESAAFDAICRQYVAQFYPDAVHKQIRLAVEFNEMDSFESSEKHLVSPGWMAVLGGVKQAPAKGQQLEAEDDLDDEASADSSIARKPGSKAEKPDWDASKQ